MKAVWDWKGPGAKRPPLASGFASTACGDGSRLGSEITTPPTTDWGFFKVPGSWPGITDYLQNDAQTIYPHPRWKTTRLAGVTTAWYERQITIPARWRDRRVSMTVEYLNSYAAVFIDGKLAGEIRYPGGELDLTKVCRPGRQHVLSMLIAALPLKGVMLSYVDTASARQVKGSVARRGLCGDVYLVGTPAGARIDDVGWTHRSRKGRSLSTRRWTICPRRGVLLASKVDGRAAGDQAGQSSPSPPFTRTTWSRAGIAFAANGNPTDSGTSTRRQTCTR